MDHLTKMSHILHDITSKLTDADADTANKVVAGDEAFPRHLPEVDGRLHQLTAKQIPRSVVQQFYLSQGLFSIILRRPDRTS